ncbi:MAG: hypothetical protein GVY08_03995 [Bacteroidetes bacterium]|jgi:two-component system LytT family response regulator|nr:hypothetical protein [Bacteroidota bacterium]
MNRLSHKDTVLLCDGDKCQLVNLSDVRYFETYGNYCRTCFTEGMLLINRSLQYLETRLPSRTFFRVNRQYIVNLHHIENLQKSENSQFKITLRCGKEIEVSRRRSAHLQEQLGL